MEIRRDKKGRIAWNCFSSIETAKDLSEYLTREYEHTTYNHYATLKNMDSILENREIWISDVRGFNDKKDKEQFANNLCFSLCFSTGVNENLSLWYLYSGIDGKGCCISFDKSKIQKLILNGRYELWKFNDSHKKEKICDIENGNNARIKFVDVLYANDKISVKKREEGKMALKYNTMTNYKIPEEEFSEFKKENIGRLKGLIWYYEKETRLLVYLLDEELRQKVDNCNKKYYDELYNRGECYQENYKVVLNFGHLAAKDFSIGLAPGVISLSEFNSKEYKNIIKYRDDTSKLHLSEYNGEINFNLKDKLCEVCEKINKNGETEK